MAVGAGRVFAIKLIADSNPVTTAFKKVGEAAGRLPTPMLAAAAAITAGFALIVTGVSKVTKALFDLGQEFDDVYDDIRINTGITGAALGELEDSFRDVARVVPNDFADIGVAIQDLNTRLGLSGDPLEALAIQLLTVSRLMGGDIGTNVRTATRLFGDFGVEADEQAGVLDMLFRAAQGSGQTFDVLADQTVNYGADLRALGFGLDDSVAMLALFERAGVNTENVMSGLRRAVSNLAKDGQDIPTAFAGAITSIRDAATESEGFALAVELVGTRYASNLVDTIRGGKFDLDTFIATVLDGSETIMGAASETDGFRESWQNFKNYIKLTLEPVAAGVFANLELLIADLTPAVDNVKKAFDEDGLEGALAQLAIEWDKIYKDKLEPLWIGFLAFLNDVVKPIALELGKDIGAAIASGMWSAFKAGVSRLFGKGLGESLFGVDFSRLDDFELTNSSTRTLDQLLADYGGSALTVPDPRRDARSYESRMLRMADGGLVTSPVMAQVGEAGPEVVIPLDRFERQYGSGSSVVINVSGALDAEGTARTILRVLRDAERRSGDRLGV